jgi:hypothetical protein
MGFSSRCIYFPTIIKAEAKFPCRGAAGNTVVAFISQRPLTHGAGAVHDLVASATVEPSSSHDSTVRFNRR